MELRWTTVAGIDPHPISVALNTMTAASLYRVRYLVRVAKDENMMLRAPGNGNA